MINIFFLNFPNKDAPERKGKFKKGLMSLRKGTIDTAKRVGKSSAGVVTNSAKAVGHSAAVGATTVGCLAGYLFCAALETGDQHDSMTDDICFGSCDVMEDQARKVKQRGKDVGRHATNLIKSPCFCVDKTTAEMNRLNEEEDREEREAESRRNALKTLDREPPV